jgi:prepilin-type N-terminal cleavage/methylation domain-containing protein
MKASKGFTLIELMVVILIVGILAAVAIPIMRGRIESAKWSEGKAMAGTVATAIRAYAAEKGQSLTLSEADRAAMGFLDSDFDGTYFDVTNFTWTSTYEPTADPPLTFTITVTPPDGFSSTTPVTLNQDGVWGEGL